MTSRLSRPSRRSFLEIAGLATGGLLMRRSLLGGTAWAAESEPKFLLLVYFGGGWDQLLALDPRDATQSKYNFVGDQPPSSGIYPGYTESAARDASLKAVMTATGGTGVQSVGGLTFGPAVPAELTAHASDLSIIRGIAMDTLTHEVGRRYFLTGKLPRGLAASGSSLNTVVVGRTGSALDLPNLSVGSESYNEGFPAVASAVQVTSANDVRSVLKPQAQVPALLTTSEATLATFEGTSDSCEAHGYDASGLVAAFRDGQAQARKMAASASADLFQFANPPPNDEVAKLFTEMELDPAKELNSAKARAALAAQAISHDVSQVVSLSLADGLDDHFELAGAQSPALSDGFRALGLLIKCLKGRPYGTSGKSYWDYTSLMVFSEFARSPLFNSRDGRDHHLASSCLVRSPGLKGGTVFGGTSDNGMEFEKWDFATGARDAGGLLIRPPDVHATLLSGMGLDFSHISNQSPHVITSLLK
jgi:uncharacterized protein (DUF1501 family)